METVKIIVDVLQFLILGGIGIWVWLFNRNDRTAETLAGHGEKIAGLEAKLASVPGHDDLEALRSEMSDVKAAVEGVAGELKQISRTLELINQHLLRSASGG